MVNDDLLSHVVLGTLERSRDQTGWLDRSSVLDYSHMLLVLFERGLDVLRLLDLLFLDQLALRLQVLEFFQLIVA